MTARRWFGTLVPYSDDGNFRLTCLPPIQLEMARSEPFNVRRVAIIGAGPAGIAAAKYAARDDVFL